MKKSVFVLLLFLSTFKFCEAQTTWINKEVGIGLYVQFPTEPTYKTQDKSGIYTSKTTNCIFMVVVTYDAIPRYADFLKLSSKNQNQIIDVYLDGVIKGKLRYTNNPESPGRTIKIGKYDGREISYSAINPITGEIGKRFSKILLINNKIYSFECWYLTDLYSSENEKDLFFNSITAS